MILSNTSSTRVDGWWIVMATVRFRLHTEDSVSAIVKAVVESAYGTTQQHSQKKKEGETGRSRPATRTHNTIPKPALPAVPIVLYGMCNYRWESMARVIKPTREQTRNANTPALKKHPRNEAFCFFISNWSDAAIRLLSYLITRRNYVVHTYIFTLCCY